MQMISKFVVVAALATTALATPPKDGEYGAPQGSWGADGQWTTCTDGETSTVPAEPVTTPASTPAVPYETPSSVAAPPTSSTPVDPVSEPSTYATPSSTEVSPVSSSPAPSSTTGVPEFPSCWNTCFEENGSPAKDALCGNTAVSDCIKDSCEEADASQYESWLADYCGVSSSSSSSSSSSASSSALTTSSSVEVPSSYPATTSSSTEGSPEGPSSYVGTGGSTYKTSSTTPGSPEGPSSSKPSSYEISSTEGSPEGPSSYATSSPVSSSTPYSPIGTGVPNLPTCWSACFDKNGVTSQEALCGNGAVGECIKETCKGEDVTQYKQWLAKFCAGSSGSTPVVGPTGGYTKPPTTITTDVTTIYTTTCPASSEYTSDSSTLTSYYTTVSTVTTTYQTTKTIPSGPTTTPASPEGPETYPVSTVVNTEVKTYTLGHGDSTSVYTTTIKSTSTIYSTKTVYLTKPTESATEGSPEGPATSGVFTSQGTEYSVSGTKTYTISSTSTLTNYVTVYPAGSGSPGSPGESYPTGAPGGGEGTCSPKTVTVTESEVVTVTVGGDSGSGSGTTVGPIQSSSAPYYPTGTYPASSGVAGGSSGFVTKTKSGAVPSGTGSGDCWGKCFAENGISGKDALCGNDAVTGCITDVCGAESSAAYEKWLNEYCVAPSSSSTPAGPVTTSSAEVPPAYETTSSTPADPATTSTEVPPPAYETPASSSTPAAPVTTSSEAVTPPAYETPAESTPADPVPTTEAPPAYETPVESATEGSPEPTTTEEVPEYTAPPAYSFAPESSSAAPAPPAYTKL